VGNLLRILQLHIGLHRSQANHPVFLRSLLLSHLANLLFNHQDNPAASLLLNHQANHHHNHPLSPLPNQAQFLVKHPLYQIVLHRCLLSLHHSVELLVVSLQRILQFLRSLLLNHLANPLFNHQANHHHNHPLSPLPNHLLSHLVSPLLNHQANPRLNHQNNLVANRLCNHHHNHHHNHPLSPLPNQAQFLVKHPLYQIVLHRCLLSLHHSVELLVVSLQRILQLHIGLHPNHHPNQVCSLR